MKNKTVEILIMILTALINNHLKLQKQKKIAKKKIRKKNHIYQDFKNRDFQLKDYQRMKNEKKVRKLDRNFYIYLYK